MHRTFHYWPNVFGRFIGQQRSLLLNNLMSHTGNPLFNVALDVVKSIESTNLISECKLTHCSCGSANLAALYCRNTNKSVWIDAYCYRRYIRSELTISGCLYHTYGTNPLIIAWHSLLYSIRAFLNWFERPSIFSFLTYPFPNKDRAFHIVVVSVTCSLYIQPRFYYRMNIHAAHPRAAV